MRRRTTIAAIAAGLALALALFAWLRPGWFEDAAERFDPHSDHAAFERWLAASQTNRADFAAFSAYLAGRGVDDVVPAWQLTRSDDSVAALCSGAFAVPPRAVWPNAVPVLAFVRGEVIPVVGPVEAVSAWRSPAANRCAMGATGSKHLSFAGIDFVAPGQADNRMLFARLCALQRRLDPSSRFGLGAYFDPADPAHNRRGRFHIDLAGYRSWGRSYRAGSSACLTRK